MKRKKIFLMVMICMMSCSMCRAGGIGIEDEYSSTCEKARMLMQKNDLSALESLANEIQQNWPKKNMSRYGDLSVTVLGAWYTVSGREKKRLPVETTMKYAEKVVSTYDPAKADNISIESHLNLLDCIHGAYVLERCKLDAASLVMDREKGTERWMLAWDRLEKAIDPTWKEGFGAPDTFVFQDGDFIIYSDTPLESVKDPLMREKYKKAIEDNNKLAERNCEQSHLRSVRKLAVMDIKKYFAKVYAVEPYDDERMEAILKKHVKDDAIRNEIIEAVKLKKSEVAADL